MRFLRVDDEHPLTGWHVLVMVALFFAIVIGVNITLAIFATGTFPGLVVKNSYVASQNYNAVLAEARAQSEKVTGAQLTANTGVLEFRLADASGAFWRNLDVTAFAGRPASDRDDRAIAFTQTGEAYRADAALPAGRWIVEVEARNGDAVVFRHSQKLSIKNAGKDGTAGQ